MATRLLVVRPRVLAMALPVVPVVRMVHALMVRRL
jgi:hypothetical protein